MCWSTFAIARSRSRCSVICQPELRRRSNCRPRLRRRESSVRPWPNCCQAGALRKGSPRHGEDLEQAIGSTRTAHACCISLAEPVTEQFLPMKIDPKPDRLVRVLVGRHDVLTPEREKEIDALVERLNGASNDDSKSADTSLDKLGRYRWAAQKRRRHGSKTLSNCPQRRNRCQSWRNSPISAGVPFRLMLMPAVVVAALEQRVLRVAPRGT